MSLLSFVLIGCALWKYYRRYRELEVGVTDESQSDFLDVYSPIVIAGILTVGVTIAVTISINEWEKSRYP
jgi:hypothetical protein